MFSMGRFSQWPGRFAVVGATSAPTDGTGMRLFALNRHASLALQILLTEVSALPQAGKDARPNFWASIFVSTGALTTPSNPDREPRSAQPLPCAAI